MKKYSEKVLPHESENYSLERIISLVHNHIVQGINTGDRLRWMESCRRYLNDNLIEPTSTIFVRIHRSDGRQWPLVFDQMQIIVMPEDLCFEQQQADKISFHLVCAFPVS